jgi:hypothetical protein
MNFLIVLQKNDNLEFNYLNKIKITTKLSPEPQKLCCKFGLEKLYLSHCRYENMLVILSWGNWYLIKCTCRIATLCIGMYTCQIEKLCFLNYWIQ